MHSLLVPVNEHNIGSLMCGFELGLGHSKNDYPNAVLFIDQSRS